MRLDRRRENLWRSTCCESMKLLQLFATPTWTMSWTKGRIWHGIDSIMAWHLACEMPWSLQWQSCPRGSKLVPVLTCCTLWPRRWRCVNLHVHTGGQGSSDAYQDKYRRYPTPAGCVATLVEEEMLLPDPEPLDPGVPEPDIIEGLSLRMTQAMNHYQ